MHSVLDQNVLKTINGRKMGFSISQTWVLSLNSPIMNWLTLGKLLNLSESESPQLENGDDI